MQEHITCPKCHAEINIESILSERLEARHRSAWAERQKALDDRETKLAAQQLSQQAEVTRLVNAGKTNIQAQIRQEIEQEYATLKANETSLLRRQLNEQTEKVTQLLTEQGNLMREKRQLAEEKAAVEATVEKRLAEERGQIESRAVEQANQKALMAIQEKDLKIKQLTDRVEDLKRTAEQGSQQIQGEAQELALESLLKQTYPFDLFEEIKKGENGADLIQTVRNQYGKACGSILYESKRTRAFSEDWIAKLKADMQARKADIGVIVAQTLPKNVDQFDWRDDCILICTFEQVKAISCLLRASLLRVDGVRVVQANQADKTQRLYEYLTSAEFEHVARSLYGNVLWHQADLAQERRLTQRHWKKRQVQLDAAQADLIGLVESVNGIAGLTLVEFDDFEVLDEEPAGLLED